LRRIKTSYHDVFIKLVIFNEEMKMVSNKLFSNFYIRGGIIDENNIDYILNDSCNQIKIIQEHLKKIGFYREEVNGILDDKTLSCIQNLQKYFNNKISNSIDFETKKILNKKRYDYCNDNIQERIIIKRQNYKFSIHNIPEIYDRNKIITILKISILFWSSITKNSYKVVDSLKKIRCQNCVS
jgi:hypothetical protein